MTKILITGDIHNGHESQGRSMFAMKVIREYAKNNGNDTVVVLGDLFDNRESIKIDVISEVSTFFNSAKNVYNQNWIIFPGNHDMFLRNSWDINSLSFLHSDANVVSKTVKFKIDDQTFWILPFIHHEDVYMDAVKQINDQASEDDVLLTHIGVNSAIMNECFLLKNWNTVSFIGTKFKRVFTGHFHNHQTIDDRVTYPGSPIAFRFDEGLVEHGFLEYDIDNNKFEFIKTLEQASKFGFKAPPDYITILDDDIDIDNLQLKDQDSNLISNNNIRVSLGRDYTSNELSTIRALLLDKYNANRVVWHKSKKKEDDEVPDNLNAELTSGKPILEVFYEHDKPDGIDKVLLMKLDSMIVEAAERVTAAKQLEEEDAYQP